MFKPNTERIPRRQPFPLKKNVSRASAQKIFGAVMLMGVCGGILLGSPLVGSRKRNITGNIGRPITPVEEPSPKKPRRKVKGEIRILESPTIVK